MFEVASVLRVARLRDAGTFGLTISPAVTTADADKSNAEITNPKVFIVFEFSTNAEFNNSPELEANASPGAKARGHICRTC
jgi:hypothetical protein